jgi:hypothetical protein
MKKLTAFLASVIISFSVFAQDVKSTAKTSIAMLNYLATESKIIEKSRTNRMVLEEIRHKIENTINPSVVDQRTQQFLNELLFNFQRDSVQACLYNKNPRTGMPPDFFIPCRNA